MHLSLARIQSYDGGTHTALVALLSEPYQAIPASCTEQTAAADLTAGTLVVAATDATGYTVVLATIG